MDALVVFLKEEQAKVKGVENTLDKHYKDNNSSWAGKYFIQIFGSIAI